MLSRMAEDDPFGVSMRPEHQAYTRPTPTGTITFRRADIEAWLAWKALREAQWVKVGTMAAIIGAIGAVVAAVLAGISI